MKYPVEINQMFIDLDALLETWREEDDTPWWMIRDTLVEMTEVIEDLYKDEL